MRRCKLADREVVAAQRLEDVAPRAIGQRSEQRVELVV